MTIKVIYAPEKLIYEPDNETVFLSGSIEQGVAEQWQSKLVSDLQDLKLSRRVTFFNPRRKDWDSSWTQSILNAQFREQVNWELKAIEEANIVAVYFDPATKSPITLLELGLVLADDDRRMVIYCPEGYWRKGNVDIVCRRYGKVNCLSWEDFVLSLKEEIER